MGVFDVLRTTATDKALAGFRRNAGSNKMRVIKVAPSLGTITGLLVH